LHRACSDLVAPGERVCSLVAFVCPWPSRGVSERTPEQPTTMGRAAHPSRNVSTTAMRCPRRIATTHPHSLDMYLLLLILRSMPHDVPWRISTQACTPNLTQITSFQVPLNGQPVEKPSMLPSEHCLGAQRHDFVASWQCLPSVQIPFGLSSDRTATFSTGCGGKLYECPLRVPRFRPRWGWIVRASHRKWAPGRCISQGRDVS
jgi:hypothetical protein